MNTLKRTIPSLVLFLLVSWTAVGQDTRFRSFLNSYDSKSGLNNDYYEMVIPARYERISEHYNDGLIAVRKDEKWGYININQKVIIPYQYDDAHDFENGVAVVEKRKMGAYRNSAYALINTKGDIIVPFFKYDEIKVYRISGKLNIEIRKRSKVGLIDSLGRELIPPQYAILSQPHSVSPFVNDYAIVSKRTNIHPWHRVRFRQYRRANSHYSFSFSGISGRPYWPPSPTIKQTYVGRDGKKLIPFKYHSVYDFSEKMGIVCSRNKSERCIYGYINREGKLVIPIEYDDAYGFSNGLAAVMKNKKWGLINKENQVVIPLIYQSISRETKDIIRVELDNKWGVINSDGALLIPIEQDYLWKSKELELMEVQKDHKCGILDLENNIIIPLIYDNARFFHQNVIKVKNDGLYGLVDINRNEILPLEYQKIGRVNEGLFYLKKAEKMGFANINGDIVIPLTYDHVGDFHNGYAQATIGDDYFFIDKSGKRR